MAISATDILGTIPLGTYVMVFDSKNGIKPWKGWASMHSHYSEVNQVAGFSWKNDPRTATCLEMFRWSLVACAFIFFALFGFAVEAREQCYRLYKLLARRIGTSPSAAHGAPHPYVARSLCRSVLIHWSSYHSFFAVLHQSLM
jgi:pheromone a factor receptor